jgi:hypothetical protein
MSSVTNYDFLDENMDVVADVGNQVVLKKDPNGILTTYTPNGAFTFNASGKLNKAGLNQCTHQLGKTIGKVLSEAILNIPNKLKGISQSDRLKIHPELSKLLQNCKNQTSYPEISEAANKILKTPLITNRSGQ